MESTLNREENGGVLDFASAYRESLGDGTAVVSQMDVNSNDQSPLSSNISASKPEGEVAPVAVSRKRQLSVDPPNSLGDQGFANLEEPGDLPTLINEDPFLNPCPEGIHPKLWDVLKSIKSDTGKMNDQINYTS